MLKHFVILLAAFCACNFVCGAELSEASKSLLNNYNIYTITHNGTAIKADVANCGADIKANADLADRHRVACMITLAEIYNAKEPMTFAQIQTIYKNNCKAYNCDRNNIGILLFAKRINNKVTDAQMTDMINAYNNITNERDKMLNLQSLVGVLNSWGRHAESMALLDKEFKGKELKNWSMFKLYTATSFAINGKHTDYVVKTYFDLAAAGKLDSAQLANINDMIIQKLSDANLDVAAFKKQLGRIKLVYMNRMTSEAGKKQYGTFVSVIDNTIKSL